VRVIGGLFSCARWASFGCDMSASRTSRLTSGGRAAKTSGSKSCAASHTDLQMLALVFSVQKLKFLANEYGRPLQQSCCQRL
jgi:hypothetical protein